jgi:hypothetical protein
MELNENLAEIIKKAVEFEIRYEQIKNDPNEKEIIKKRKQITQIQNYKKISHMLKPYRNEFSLINHVITYFENKVLPDSNTL